LQPHGIASACYVYDGSLDRHAAGDLTSPYVLPHTAGPKAGEPVREIKNGFHRALELAEIGDFTWHDLRHTFVSWLMMRGASLRSVAELLGHQSLKMTMRYAHLSPAFLSAEVGLLDPPAPAKAKSKRARKGQRASTRDQRGAKVVKFPNENGSSGWIRTRSR
jgi:integrase